MYLGPTLFKEERYKEAAIVYEKVQAQEKAGIKLDRLQHRILVDQLVMSYGLSGRSAAAKALLHQSIRTDPEYPLNYYNLACVSADEDEESGVWKNLTLAFQHRDHVLPGEQMPDPASDPVVQEVRSGRRLQNVVGATGSLAVASMRHPGRPVTHRRLLGSVWGAEYRDELEYLRTFMRHFARRSKTILQTRSICLPTPTSGIASARAAFTNPLSRASCGHKVVQCTHFSTQGQVARYRAEAPTA